MHREQLELFAIPETQSHPKTEYPEALNILGGGIAEALARRMDTLIYEDIRYETN